MSIGESIEILLPRGYDFLQWKQCKIVAVCMTRFCIVNPALYIFGRDRYFVWIDKNMIDDSEEIYPLKVRLDRVNTPDKP